MDDRKLSLAQCRVSDAKNTTYLPTQYAIHCQRPSRLFGRSENAGFSFPGGTIEIFSWSGSETTVLAKTSLPPFNADQSGRFQPVKVAWTTPGSGSAVGKKLGIRLQSNGAETIWDNVSLDASPASDLVLTQHAAWQTLDLGAGQGRYGPSMIINNDNSIDSWVSSPAWPKEGFDPLYRDWFVDYIRHRKSWDGGQTWSETNAADLSHIALRPTPSTAGIASSDHKSTCDPGAIKIGNYYYLGYTGWEDSAAFNGVCFARSTSPSGPFEKWNGSSWGGIPKSALKTNNGGAYGIGEPSLVLMGPHLLFVYYTQWIAPGIWTTNLALCYDATAPNWPSALVRMGPVISHNYQLPFVEDSVDIKYIDSLQRFIGVSVSNRALDESNGSVWQSGNGICWERAPFFGARVAKRAHNIGISGNSVGHIDTTKTNIIGYDAKKTITSDWFESDHYYGNVSFALRPRLKAANSDFDGDFISDTVYLRPSTSQWRNWLSMSGISNWPWGSVDGRLACADFNGDKIVDRAIYQPTTGQWWVLPSDGGPNFSVSWGAPNYPYYKLQPGDFDGDGKADYVFYDASDSRWWFKYSATNTTNALYWGAVGDVPVAGDYDGDGVFDMATWRSSTGGWYVNASSSGGSAWFVTAPAAGVSIPVPADYDGDGKTDCAIYQQAGSAVGTWTIRYSSTGAIYSHGWGVTSDVPVPADYDGDGRTDIAIWRPSTGARWIIRSSTHTSYFVNDGSLSGDLPTAAPMHLW